MRGNMNILGSSDFTYVLKDSPLTVEDRLNETVTFVEFSDTTHIAKPHIPAMSLGGMDILMTLHIDEAVQARVNLNESGSNYMLLEAWRRLVIPVSARRKHAAQSTVIR